MTRRKDKEMGKFGMQYAPGKKLCNASYYFLDYVLKNPGCTGGEIADYLFPVVGVPKYNYWHWLRTGRLHKDRGRFAYLLSPYHSNMLSCGRRTTPMTNWVYRLKQEDPDGKKRRRKKMWRYYPTVKLVEVFKNLEPKNEVSKKYIKPDVSVGKIITFKKKTPGIEYSFHCKRNPFNDVSPYYSLDSFPVEGNIMVTGFKDDMKAIQVTNGTSVGYTSYETYNRLHHHYDIGLL